MDDCPSCPIPRRAFGDGDILKRTGFVPRAVKKDEAGEPYEFVPGVMGIAIEHDGRIYVQYIEAVRQGSGHVGRFLDDLDPGCILTYVINARMRGMLERRGWKKDYGLDPYGRYVDLWTMKIPRRALGDGVVSEETEYHAIPEIAEAASEN